MSLHLMTPSSPEVFQQSILQGNFKKYNFNLIYNLFKIDFFLLLKFTKIKHVHNSQRLSSY